MCTFDPGFTSTASCESAITFIDGNKGVLLYRGCVYILGLTSWGWVSTEAGNSHTRDCAVLLLYITRSFRGISIDILLHLSQRLLLPLHCDSRIAACLCPTQALTVGLQFVAAQHSAALRSPSNCTVYAGTPLRRLLRRAISSTPPSCCCTESCQARCACLVCLLPSASSVSSPLFSSLPFPSSFSRRLSNL